MTDGAGVLICSRYLLLEPVGEGGMGRVWRGRDQVLDREVAVKEVLLPPSLPAETRAQLVARTMREARATARIDHPSVITIHDVAEHDGIPWIVMQFVRGPSLGAEIRRNGRLPWQRVAEIGQQVAEALAEAHAAGIVHRDLKPDNILLPGQRAIVTDFGIARVADAATRLTSTGAIIGTPSYMAPEQFDDRAVSPATDMWALGATLYCAVEGRPPFDGSTLSAIIGAVLAKPCQPPQQAGPLGGLIQSLLAKDSTQRPDAAAAARMLAGHRTAAPADAPLPVGQPPGGQPAARPPAASHGPASGNATVTVSPAPVTPGPGPLTGAGAGKRTRFRPRITRAITITAISGAAAAIAAVALFLSDALSAPGISGPITGTLSATLKNPESGACSVAFSGNVLAVSEPYGGTYLWDITTRKITATLSQPGNGLNSIAFSPNGSMLAGGNSDGTYLWDVTSRKITATLTDPGGSGVSSVAFSPDGKTLAVGDADGSTYLWDTATRKLTAALSIPGVHTDIGVSALAYSPDGSTLAVGGPRATYLWDITTRKVTATLTSPGGTSVNAVAFSPDGSRLAVGGPGATYLWDIATRKIIATLSVAGGLGFNSVAFSPDGGTLAAGAADGTYLWYIATRKVTAILTDPGGTSTNSVAFGPDSTFLATGDYDGRTYLWKIARS